MRRKARRRFAAGPNGQPSLSDCEHVLPGGNNFVASGGGDFPGRIYKGDPLCNAFFFLASSGVAHRESREESSQWIYAVLVVIVTVSCH